eukprot:1002134-Pelagomonas_calceolata.AAC.1
MQTLAPRLLEKNTNLSQHTLPNRGPQHPPPKPSNTHTLRKPANNRAKRQATLGFHSHVSSNCTWSMGLNQCFRDHHEPNVDEAHERVQGLQGEKRPQSRRLTAS